ncbi:MAG: shikimate dehydrogenase, partial [Cyanobacteria bacterium REEB65]|nr:shikimate dehydrogenase [Cyanobacteria bacterium REEB65]
MRPGQARLFGLLGYPLGHSLSPAIMNAALRAAGVDGVYLAFPVPPALLEAAVIGIRAFGFAGVNVTIPHKTAIMAHLDGLTRRAEEIGAVNTLYWDGDRLIGDNTDAAGYEAMLASSGDVPRGRALILGAGGAARAVATVLAERGLAVGIAGRDSEAVSVLVSAIAGRQARIAMAVRWQDRGVAAQESNLVVNCTPVGTGDPEALPLDPRDIALLAPGTLVHDLV